LIFSLTRWKLPHCAASAGPLKLHGESIIWLGAPAVKIGSTPPTSVIAVDDSVGAFRRHQHDRVAFLEVAHFFPG
jgi:hypothetical protein